MKRKDLLADIQTEFKIEMDKFSNRIIEICNDANFHSDKLKQEAIVVATKEFHTSYDLLSERIQQIL